MLRTIAGIAVAITLTGWGATACAQAKSPHALASSFALDDHATRVFATYNQRTHTQTSGHRVRIPAGTRRLIFQTDCVRDGGRITVSVTGLGGGGGPCRSVGEAHAHVDLQVTASHRPRRVTVTVEAPPGSRWSAAVDAAP